MNDLQERIKFVNRGLTVYVTEFIIKQMCFQENTKFKIFLVESSVNLHMSSAQLQNV
jgi:hypothetical protein